MKKYIIIIILSFFAADSIAQSYQTFFKDSIGFFPQSTSAVRGYFQGRWRADTLVVSQRDTTWHPVFVGTITTPDGISLYIWDGTKWNALSGGGGGSGTVTSVGLTMPTGFSVANSPITTSGTLAVTTNLNGILQGNGSNTIGTVTIGTGLSYSAPTLSTTDWHLTGNTGTTAGTNFVGTTNSQSLVFKVNNTQSGFIDNSVLKNVSFGKNTFAITVTGGLNSAFGVQGLFDLTSGTGNTVAGYNGLANVTEGSSNTSVGSQSLVNLITGSGNTANGAGALSGLGVFNGGLGDDNTAIGSGALVALTEGNLNIGIGVASFGVGSVVGNNNIALGNKTTLATDTGSNQLNIHNVIYGLNDAGEYGDSTQGRIGIGIPNPLNKLDIGGDLRIRTITSGTAGTDSVLVQSSGGIVKKISATYYSTGGGTTTNAVTFNNSGSGAASGTTFDGSAARTISHNTIGAVPYTGATADVDLGANDLTTSATIQTFNTTPANGVVITAGTNSGFVQSVDIDNALGIRIKYGNTDLGGGMRRNISNNAGELRIFSDSSVNDARMTFYTKGGRAMLIDSNRYVLVDNRLGIGATPRMLLEVGGGGQGIIQTAGTYQGIFVASPVSRGQITLADGDGVQGGFVTYSGVFHVGTYSSNAMDFVTNNTERGRIGPTGNWAIGNTTDYASAQLAVNSTSKGFLPPRMTATQASAIASLEEGLLVYVTDTNGTFTAKGWWGYDGSSWQKLNN